MTGDHDPVNRKSVASLSCGLRAEELAEWLAGALSASGVKCSAVSTIGSGATFTSTIDRQNVLVAIGIRAHDPATAVITIGRAQLPLAKLVGLSREASRQALGEAIDSALVSRDDIVDLQWHSDEAWAVVRPDLEAKHRRWWHPRS